MCFSSFFHFIVKTLCDFFFLLLYELYMQGVRSIGCFILYKSLAHEIDIFHWVEATFGVYYQLFGVVLCLLISFQNREIINQFLHTISYHHTLVASSKKSLLNWITEYDNRSENCFVLWKEFDLYFLEKKNVCTLISAYPQKCLPIKRWTLLKRKFIFEY